MPETNIASQLIVKINGSPLATDMMNTVQEVVVDQSTGLPHMFLLRLRAQDPRILDDSAFATGNAVEIAATNESGASVTIFKGESLLHIR